MISAIRDRIRRPRSRGYPPRVFVSYRWEGEAAAAWVRDLAAYLRGRGMRVCLDLDQLTGLGEQGIAIGRYVAQIVDCHYFVRVVSRDLAASVGREWLMEEQQLGAMMWHGGQVQIDLVRERPRDDDHRTAADRSRQIAMHWLASGRSASFGQLVERDVVIVDLSGDPGNFSPLDGIFDYQGPVLSDADEERLVVFMERACPLLDAGNHVGLIELLREYPDLSRTDEVGHVVARTFALSGQPADAAEIALVLLTAGTASFETRIDMCLLLGELYRHREALHHLCRIRIPGSCSDWPLASMIAEYLDRLGSHHAALNFYEYAMKLASARSVSVSANLAVNDLHAMAEAQGRQAQDVFPEYLHQRDRDREHLPTPLLNALGCLHLYRFGDPETAIRYLRRAVQADPTEPDAWTSLAVAHTAAHQLTQADAALNRVRDLLAGSPHLPELPITMLALVRAVGEGTPLPATPAYRCGTCSARYFPEDGTAVCTQCATVHDGTDGCPICRYNKIFDLGDGVPCPVCRKGEVTRDRRRPA